MLIELKPAKAILPPPHPQCLWHFLMLGVSLATIRKWERGTGEPSGAAKTLLAVARLHPKALVYEKRAANNRGVSIAYDPATHRAYFSQSHR